MFRVTFTMSDNSSFLHTFEWEDSKGTPISLADTPLMMQIKRRIKDAAVALELSTANGRIVIDPLMANKFTLFIPANTLRPSPLIDEGAEEDEPYVFDMLQFNLDGSRSTLLCGEIHVYTGVTR
ncbi:hypothetical protein [Aestuariivirga sp.]|uniref:hypothetical protein n=1 Tax=Aestuariivirga sp. TaxID=2650926 RepID=UPI003BA876AD